MWSSLCRYSCFFFFLLPFIFLCLRFVWRSVRKGFFKCLSSMWDHGCVCVCVFRRATEQWLPLPPHRLGPPCPLWWSAWGRSSGSCPWHCGGATVETRTWPRASALRTQEHTVTLVQYHALITQIHIHESSSHSFPSIVTKHTLTF